MRILHISKYFYPFIGGVEQVARDCINALPDNEHKLICFNHEKGTRTDIIDGVEIIRVGCFAKIASQSIAFGYGKQLKKVMNEFKPDVVIFHYPNPFVAHYLLKHKKKDFKLILYWHLDIYKQKLLKLFFKKQNKRLCERADKIIATSPNYIEQSPYLSLYKEKCRMVPNCVNTKRLKPTAASIELAKKIKEANPEKAICFAVGRHVPYKGMEYLIRASKLLDDNFKIYIGGQGPLTDSLKELAKDDDKVEFIGKVLDDNLMAHFIACDMFCFPSITKNEAFGIALAEAMYYGKPAVTFTINCSGVNYVSLNGITGIEVENRNVEAYAKAITELADNEAMRLQYGHNAKIRVEENFTFDKFKEYLQKEVYDFNESGPQLD